jgi:hypothetical protein
MTASKGNLGGNPQNAGHVFQIGDEGSILPPKLHDEILLALENKKEKAS